LLSEIISLASVLLALVAVCVSTWQARSNMQHARHSRALPVIAEIFKEFRSREFRESIHNLLVLPSDKMTGDGFLALPGDRREDAYKVCYFFDHIGVLVAFGIIREDVVIATMGTQIMQVWSAMFPIIESERACRSKTYPSDTPPGFLAFYEHLVACIGGLGGRQAAITIQRRIRLRRLSAAAGNESPDAPPA
jgi:hypothetical protein